MTTYTEEHAQALREALDTGEHRVSYDGKSIEYRSVSDLASGACVALDQYCCIKN